MNICAARYIQYIIVYIYIYINIYTCVRSFHVLFLRRIPRGNGCSFTCQIILVVGYCFVDCFLACTYTALGGLHTITALHIQKSEVGVV